MSAQDSAPWVTPFSPSSDSSEPMDEAEAFDQAWAFTDDVEQLFHNGRDEPHRPPMDVDADAAMLLELESAMFAKVDPAQPA